MRRTRIFTTLSEQAGSHDPVVMESRVSIASDDSSDCYQRRMIAPEQPAPIETGWIKRPGWIGVRNLVGSDRQTNPTAEQIAEERASILWIGTHANPRLFPVRPGQMLPLPIADVPLTWHADRPAVEVSLLITEATD